MFFQNWETSFIFELFFLKFGKKTERQMKRFKTNINCDNCVRAVSGFLNEVSNIREWSVDTEHPEKILTVSGNKLQPSAVLDALAEAGYDGELLEET